MITRDELIDRAIEVVKYGAKEWGWNFEMKETFINWIDTNISAHGEEKASQLLSFWEVKED